jgi:hypothetical protein
MIVTYNRHNIFIVHATDPDIKGLRPATAGENDEENSKASYKNHLEQKFLQILG